MSALVKLSSKLPGDEEINGLDSMNEDLQQDEGPLLALVWLVPTKITEDIATGERVPTVEVRRVEPIGYTGDVPTLVIQLAAELYERRTGRNPLPIDQVLAAKGDVDEIRYDTDDEGPAGDVDDVEDGGDPRAPGVLSFPDQPRLARDPAAIGDIFAFEGPEDRALS